MCQGESKQFTECSIQHYTLAPAKLPCPAPMNRSSPAQPPESLSLHHPGKPEGRADKRHGEGVDILELEEPVELAIPLKHAKVEQGVTTRKVKLQPK